MKFDVSYNYIISIENLLSVWQNFLKGKSKRKDVELFQLNLSDNIICLHNELTNKQYIHGGYSVFYISDPKSRIIHKASVKDRIVHHLLYKELHQYFDSRFIYDSFSCRDYKGTHKAIERFRNFAGKVSKNNTKQCWVLKCDIKKFFANIDHKILKEVLKRYLVDNRVLKLFFTIIDSFNSGENGKGLPLGNLTSQLLVNVYMHEFDMYLKQELRVKYYIRYADDFVILSDDKDYLTGLLNSLEKFLNEKLKLNLHPDKVYIKTYSSGIDFLGWINYPYHKQLRSVTKRKIMRGLTWYPARSTINSYRGLLNHGNTFKIVKKIKSY